MTSSTSPSSQSGHVMTLANSVIGVAILSMPFCFQKCGILLAIVLLCAINATTRVCCHYLVKSSLISRRRSMEIIALYVFGPSGKLMVELCTIGYLMGTCVAYFVVVGDLGPQIISKMLDIAHTDTLRVWIMCLVTVFCVIPLGLLKNVDSLSTVCTASIGFYFCLVVKVMAESWDQVIDGRWLSEVHFWRWSGVLQCLPIFCLSLSCQIVLFEVYESVTNATLSRMNDIVKSAISMVTCVYIAVGFFGYVAFYDQQFSGNILLNLEASASSDIIQMGFVMSVACSFPLVIFPCRASLYSLLYQRDHSDVVHYIPEHRYRFITLAIILPALIIGILTPSVELIIGLVGSTIGVAICIMFPATCFIKLGKRDSAELLLAKFLLVFGFFLMVLGTYANLEAFEDRTSGLQSPILNEHMHNPVDEIIVRTPVTEGVVSQVKFELPLAAKVADEVVRDKVKENAAVPKIIPVPPVEPIASRPIVVARVASERHPVEPVQQPARAPVPPAEPEINRDAIAHEEREIAIEKKQQIADEKLSDLEETKALVEQIKQELSKQNEKTQKLVLEKMEQIVDKVEHIEKVQEAEVAKTKAERMEKEKAETGEKIVIEAVANPKEAEKLESAAYEIKLVPAEEPTLKIVDPVEKTISKMVKTDDPIVNHIQRTAKANIETRSVVDDRIATEPAKPLMKIEPVESVSQQPVVAADAQVKIEPAKSDVMPAVSPPKPAAEVIVEPANLTSTNDTNEILGDRVARDLLSVPSAGD